ncbi:MAG: ATPase [Bacteroidetes bacterium]|nr:MAG: ATPase [Bacteroidota bacterium]
MRNPFVFGHLSSTENFVNRTKDIDKLHQNIDNQIHTILLSPRRWGKSSLVRVLEDKIGKSKKTVFCHLDMFNSSSEMDFYQSFSKEILKKTHNTSNDFFESINIFFKNLAPEVSFKAGNLAELSLKFDKEKTENSFVEILNLPEEIAKKKKIKIVVCIDEFQNLDKFKDPLLFQQRLRASWQHHQNVVYILYGSKRSMLSSIFESQSMPFYRFGDVLYLQKIDTSHWLKFIQSRFKKTNKKIHKKYTLRLIDEMENHSYYVQQLAYTVWNNTQNEVDESILTDSINDIIGRNAMMFESIFENLSTNQIKVIHMLVDNINAKHTSAAMINKYELVSSANVIQALKSLENKEVIDRFEGYTQFIDPVFKMWLKIRAFKD